MLVFLVAFIVSYMGSIPPGTINISTMQLAIQGKRRAAVFLSLAASLVEFIYAGITVRFQLILSESDWFTDHFYIITAIPMVVLGVANLWTSSDSKSFLTKVKATGRSGFKRGLVLGLLNPLTLPYWLTVTAYLQTHKLISLDGALFWYYLIGISVGTFLLLITIILLGKKFSNIADNQFLVHRLPGLIFIGLGTYNIIIWLSL
ncbi:MAG: LysE family transporter [Cyclobacteriaceae bacterium]|nr:LysE family transporter [Cyclobacteriaceae bacterium SS2]